MAGGNQVGCWIFIVSREEGFFKVRKLFIVTFFFFLSHNWNRRLDAIQATRSGIDPLKLTFPWDLLQGFGGNTRGGRRRQRGSESSKPSALHGGWFFSLPQYEALFFRGEKPDTITGTFRRPPLSPPPVSFSRPLPLSPLAVILCGALDYFLFKATGLRRASRIVPRCSTSSPFKRLPLSLSFSRLVATILHVVSFEYLSKMRNMNFPPHLPRFSFIPLVLFPPAPVDPHKTRYWIETKILGFGFHCSVHFFRYRGYWCLSKMIRWILLAIGIIRSLFFFLFLIRKKMCILLVEYFYILVNTIDQYSNWI